MNSLKQTLRPFLFIALAGASLGACSSDDGTTEPDAAEPVITIDGVTDGASYDGAVTITIQVEPGSYSATLNGEAFTSGGTVAQPGDYTLIVDARNGLETTTRTVNFTINAPDGGSSVLKVRLIDLGDADFGGGGGDAILLTDSSALGVEHALIDAGPGQAPGDDDPFVLEQLQALGVDTLEFVQLTHAHSDHFSGMDEVINQLHVERFIYNGQVRDLSFYNDVLNAAQAQADTVIVLSSLLQLALGQDSVQTQVTMLPPLPTYLNDSDPGSDEANEGSIGTLLERGFFTMFLAGDGEVEANARWRTDFASYTGDVDVLKVGHHGANNAIFDNGFGGASSWLDHTSPDVAVISANGRTHPREAAINRLLGLPAVYCTSVHGDIVIRVDAGGSYEVAVERNAGQDCVAGTEATT